MCENFPSSSWCSVSDQEGHLVAFGVFLGEIAFEINCLKHHLCLWGCLFTFSKGARFSRSSHLAVNEILCYKASLSMWKIPEKIFHLNTYLWESSQGHRTLSTMISSRKKINMVTLPRKKGAEFFFISLLNENIWLPCQMRLEAEFLALQKIMLEFYCLTFIWALAQCKKCAGENSPRKLRRVNEFFPKRRKLKMRKLRTFKG